MSRSKYINTFETTADYEAYINSNYPEYPNVGLDKEANKLKIQKQSFNNYILYGTVNDPTRPITFNFNGSTGGGGTNITAHYDLNGDFYLEQADLTAAGINNITRLSHFCWDTNLTSIKKMTFDCSNVTNICLFYGDTNLRSLNLNSVDFSKANVGGAEHGFYNCSSLTDVYINVEATLMKLTNNLSSQGSVYIPGNATIHYNDTDYKWQNNAWTAQS